jgi:glucose-1-phosphate thymidylyltransferase
MKVIIPLAGKGERLRPHTITKPKSMLSVAGKPILGHILDRLKNVEVDEIIFIISDFADQIKDYVNKNYTFKTIFIEQKEKLGSAHAIDLAKKYVNGPVLIIFGDTIFDADLSVINSKGFDGYIFVKDVEDPSKYGVVTIKDNFITQMVEKPSAPVSNLAMIGTYYIIDTETMFDAIEEVLRNKPIKNNEYYLTDAFEIMIKDGAKFKAVNADEWDDCGSSRALIEANIKLLDKMESRYDDGENSVIIEPVYIEEGVQIINSIVGPHTTIGKDCIIENSVIKESIIGKNTKIKDAGLLRSIVGDKAVVEGRLNRVNIGDSSEISFV